ncbi:MAG TPA: glycosyltransferase family 4 protein [Solirubrobacteraceae bacterium]|jgi:glycosyltransferase involved in cell wall biosynthesis
MSGHVLVLMEGLPYPLDPRVRAQVAALREAGFEVTVACPTGHGHDEPDLTLDGVRVLRFVAPPGGRGAFGYLREYAIAFWRLRAIVRAVRRERPVDLALVCAPPDFLVALARPLARRGAKVVFDYREISPELFEAKFGRRGPAHHALVLAERYAFRHADAVTTVSEPCAELARTRGRADPTRVFLVGNGPDPARVYQVPERPELRRGRRHLVLWLGVMSTQEGLEHLIEAADLIVNRHRRGDVHFALVGPGDVREALERDIAARGLADHVELTGLVDDELVRAYMCTADLCVAVDEPNAMNDRAAMRKVLEYLALGRAVVQFPLAEMRRLCGDATAYARSGDAADLASRICALLDDDERRRELGEAARRRVWSGQMWPQQAPFLLRAMAAAASTGVPESQIADSPVCQRMDKTEMRSTVGASSSR